MDRVKDRTGTIVARPPNWASPVSESYEYSTSIFTTNNGVEIRESSRSRPRVAISYRQDGIDRAAAEMLYEQTTFEDSGKRMVPMYWRAVDITAAASAGAAFISFEGTAPWQR